MSILPPNSTRLERALDAVQAVRLESLPVPTPHLWNPTACLAKTLPWLAWALSVDTWDPAWNEGQKRRMIKTSPALHRTKGTRRAVEDALSNLGFRVEVEEWWEKYPLDPAGTFGLVVKVPAGYAVDSTTYDEVSALADRAKNVRSRLKKISLIPEGLTQKPLFSAAMASGIVTTIYPLGRIGLGDDVR
ncbi:phage tail protein I [Desulfoluna spongiiphila]|uniref:Phage tail protein, P2 protein I family n=1 Tax=Desulfoluna spongiiphila TaxID=419481 RepID=A0A1G5ACV5_9BACT|nr:phage tail protein I [Desulfoluna spongiiphila]SCX75677.1 phage tail protein, P2 protein I family [Desulfoluna spongiiphila]